MSVTEALLQRSEQPTGTGTIAEKGIPVSMSSLWLVNLITFVGNTFITFASNLGWWGKTNQAVSNNNETLLTPAGYAFGIWGLIFTAEGLWVAWQTMPANRDHFLLVKGVGLWFAAANIAQTLWSFAFSQEQFILSAILLEVIFLSLGGALASIENARKDTSYSPRGRTRSARLLGEVLFKFPLGLHAGWVCAAGLVNIGVAVNARGAKTPGQVAFAIVSLVVVGVISYVATLDWHSVSFTAAVIWALVGIEKNTGYRKELLGPAVADGFNKALDVVAVGLAVLALIEGGRFLLASRRR